MTGIGPFQFETDWIDDMVMQALWPMCEFEACAVVLYEGQEHHTVSHIGTLQGDHCGTRTIRDARSSHFSHYMGYRTQVTLLLSIVHAYGRGRNESMSTRVYLVSRKVFDSVSPSIQFGWCVMANVRIVNRDAKYLV